MRIIPVQIGYGSKRRSSCLVNGRGRCLSTVIDRGLMATIGRNSVRRWSRLKTQDVSDEEFPVLSGHPHEASVEAIYILPRSGRIQPQHLDRCL